MAGAMRRLGSVILYVDDLERSIAFYRDVIGVPFRLRGDGYAEFDVEGTKLGLFDRSRLPDLIGRDGGLPGPTAEILFLVTDADAEADRLRQAGASILTGPIDRPWGHRTVHLLDPDGHVVEMAQEIPRTDR
jgi:lactoylglutathione lyase